MDEAADITARTQPFDDAARTFHAGVADPSRKLRAIVVLLEKVPSPRM